MSINVTYVFFMPNLIIFKHFSIFDLSAIDRFFPKCLTAFFTSKNWIDGYIVTMSSFAIVTSFFRRFRDSSLVLRVEAWVMVLAS